MFSWLLVLGLIGPCEEAQAQDTTKDRPNILFIFSDDHATDAIGAYEGRLQGVNPTPHIDQMAKEGMLFRRSFCTNSICGPSRAVILTGKHSHLNGFMKNGNKFDGSQQTFPKLLQKTGYQTALIGKWHLTSDPQGFDYWDVLPGQGDYYNPVLVTNGGRRQVEGYCTDIVTELAVEWLENRDADRPFMLMCQHKAPHRCWMPPLRYLHLYDDIDIPEPTTLFDSWDDNASPARFQEMSIDRHMNLVYDLFLEPWREWDPKAGRALDKSGFRNLEKMTADQRMAWDAAYGPKNQQFRDANHTGEDLVRWKYQRYLKNYLRCIRGVDDSVGRLMRYLQEKGLDDNTVVVYSSDQGFYLGDHGWYDKRWMYEESLSMPLIIKWPEATTPGTVCDQLVQNLDYGPTFLELSGTDIPSDMQGHSLVPLLKGEEPKWRDAIYYHYHGFPAVHMVARHYGIRTERYKLIHFYQFDEWEFYDLKEDPDELTNQYGAEGHQATIESLKEKLVSIRSHYKDDIDISPLPQEEQDRYRGETP